MTANRIAYEVDISSMRCVVFALTAAKARWIAVKRYWDAGYGRKGIWPRPVAIRVPALDNSPLAIEVKQKAWVPEYAYSTI